MDHWQRITPPPSLGTPPQAPPTDNLLARSTALFFSTPVRGSEPGVLRGHPSSPGTARAGARVIHRLAEAGTLQPGDVLVAEATAPTWTLLFAVASAVVTDVGGVLSHCAVVAREYHIPAVVGTGDATTRIADGQLLEVDGNAGIVRLLE
jgi:phosphoenolpyruvate synthase/pyruvate phosphate dikinase